ncbi:MAG: hypothetical protein M3220_03655, partial [Chloroflexota bacterium]|nr:hypothetical protein [Chloroflexota bacterium]
QPGVLPIFVNHDAPRTTERAVTVQVGSEEAGGAEEIFTVPVEIRVAEAEQLEAAPWQPWTAEVELELSPGGGEKTVVIEYRDQQGQSVRASDTIFLIQPGGPVPTSRVQLAPTLTPSATPTITPSPSPTPTPTVTPSPTATPIPTPVPPLLLPVSEANFPLLLTGVSLLTFGLISLFSLILRRPQR